MIVNASRKKGRWVGYHMATEEGGEKTAETLYDAISYFLP